MVTVALPFRSADKKTIVLQRQTFKAKGDAHYWSEGNQDKNRFVGYWRYIDKEMVAKINLDHVTPKWFSANDEQTCPLFTADGEYDHDKGGKFDFSAAGKQVNIRLHMWPQACGQEDLMSKAIFSGAATVTSLKLKDKCCYMTKFQKEWCQGTTSTLLDKMVDGKVPGVADSNKDGVFSSMWEYQEMEVDPTVGSGGDVPVKVVTKSTDNMFVSRYWNHVMMHIREWNFRYRPGGDKNILPLGDDNLKKMAEKLTDSDYPNTTA